MMPDLQDGQTFEMQGSGANPYVLKNTGGVYSCTCPAWRNQSTPIERRTCKHLRKLRGDTEEEARCGAALPQRPTKTASDGDGDGEAGPPLLLAESWDSTTDLSGWWMSEKLDGVRAYWDGKQFLSRQGNLYHAPAWFAQGLPDVPLDGELWIARKKFQRTVSIVRRQDKSELWKEVRYLVFDAPSAGGGFEERMGYLREMLSRRPIEYTQMHEQQLCCNVDCLKEELARVEMLGGEGLMLRQPASKYVSGRSSTLLKIKNFRDAEALVIGHQAGEGRHKGRLGALLVRLADGTDFAIGTGFSDRERATPPAVGASVTFRYQELSDRGVPRFPSYVGVREDVSAAAAIATAKSVPAPPKPEVIASGSAGSEVESRHFEYAEGTSAKFWEISQSGNAMTTRWGRIGTAGQSKTKTFANEASAAEAVAALIETKTKEGYVEIAG